MTNQELSLLYALACFLSSNPTNYQKGIDMLSDRKMSDEYAGILRTISKEFKRRAPSTLDDVAAMANEMYHSSKKVTSRAGTVLKWGLPDEYWCCDAYGWYEKKCQGGNAESP